MNNDSEDELLWKYQNDTPKKWIPIDLGELRAVKAHKKSKTTKNIKDIMEDIKIKIIYNKPKSNINMSKKYIMNDSSDEYEDFLNSLKKI